MSLYDPLLAAFIRFFLELFQFIFTGEGLEQFRTSAQQPVPRWVLRVVLGVLLILAMIALLVGSIFLVLWIFGGR